MGNVGSMTYLDFHSLDIVESVHETLQVTTMSQLIRIGNTFERRSIAVIVVGVAIDESVEEKSVEGKSPAVGRGSIVVSRPFSPEVQRINGGLILVEVDFRVGLIELVCCGQENMKRKRNGPFHNTPHDVYCASWHDEPCTTAKNELGGSATLWEKRNVAENLLLLNETGWAGSDRQKRKARR